MSERLPERGDTHCSCGNAFGGDNLCMISACQWEGIEPEQAWLDCTCGHPYADHSVGVCDFKGCGCGLIDVTTPSEQTATEDRP